MKQSLNHRFHEYAESIPEDQVKKLKVFFSEFHIHCRLRKKEKFILKNDFKNAILYYHDAGLSLTESLSLLDTKYLGGFYARPPVLWFPLDDAAKIYPLSMEHGRMSVFRLSVYLKAPVIPELLQMALNFTIKRFPSFATTLKKGFFWHYLDTTKRRFSVEKEEDIPCQPMKVSQSGSQSFRVLYYNNRISVEFFHVLTDGTGGITFLKVLLTEYLRLCGITVKIEDYILDINATPDIDEFENAFTKVPLTPKSSGFIDKPAVQMSGAISKIKPCRVLHFKMNMTDLKNTAQKYDASVTVYLLALMFLANKSATDELYGDVNIQVPVNMRKFYPSVTVRNFSMYCGIRIPLDTIKDLPSVIQIIQTQLKEKASKETMSEMLTSTEKLVNMLKYVPLVIKQPVANLVYGFLGDRIFTNTLSNLGVINLPDSILAHVDSMDFILGTAITNRANCAVITVGDTTTFSITKITVDPSFEEKMYELLLSDGIRTTVEGSDLYES